MSNFRLKDVPGYIVLLGLLALALIAYCGMSLVSHKPFYPKILGVHMSESEVEYKVYSEKVAQKIAQKNAALAKQIYDEAHGPLNALSDYCSIWRTVLVPDFVGSPPLPMWSPELQEKAEQGDLLSQGLLGKTYGDGKGIKQNWPESYFWSSLAITQGNLSAQNSCRAAQKHLSDRQVDEGKKRVLNWLKQNKKLAPNSQK
jgi:TPR repeat protein